MKTKHYVVVGTFDTNMYKGTFTKTGLKKYMNEVFSIYNPTEKAIRQLDAILDGAPYKLIDLSSRGDGDGAFIQIYEVEVNCIEK